MAFSWLNRGPEHISSVPEIFQHLLKPDHIFAEWLFGFTRSMKVRTPLVTLRCHSHTTLVTLEWLWKRERLQLKSTSKDPQANAVTKFLKLSFTRLESRSSSYPLVSCFHQRHVCLWPTLTGVIQPSRCPTQSVLSHPLCSGCDSGSALIPLPSIPSSTSQPDKGLRECRCRIITRLQLYESLEHAANITQAAPSHLPITHCWAHTGSKARGADWWES